MRLLPSRPVRVRPILNGALALILAGCTATPRIATVPPAAPAVMQMPLPPQGATAAMTLPARDEAGNWRTPNRDLSAADTVWHLRMALNVAALACADAADAPRVQYNRILARHRAELARVNGAVEAEYRVRLGAGGVAARESHNTAAYNFFALPPAQAGFCAAAIREGAVLAALPAGALSAAAPGALAALERPFMDFYTAYAAYRADLTRWREGMPAKLAVDFTGIANADAGVTFAGGRAAPPHRYAAR